MSSYLNFYLVSVEEKDKKVFFASYSRNSDIYQMFYDEFNWSNDFRELNKGTLIKMIQDLQEELYKSQMVYNKQSILKRDDILNYFEEQKEITYKLGILYFLSDILDTVEFNDDYKTIEFNFD